MQVSEPALDVSMYAERWPAKIEIGVASRGTKLERALLEGRKASCMNIITGTEG